MSEFNIRRGKSTVLFNASGAVNDNVVLEEGYWYLCTDTAELFLCVNENDVLSLKRINEGASLEVSIPTKLSELLNDCGFITEIPDNYVVEDDLAGFVYKTDLAGLASEKYVDEKVASVKIPEVPSKVSELENDKGYLTEHQSLEGYATETFVQEEIAKIDLPDVSDFITEETVDAKGFLTEQALADYAKKSDIPSHDGLATEAYVKNAIAEAQLADSEVDLTGLATKDELVLVEAKIPSINGLASEQYVNDQVAAIKVPDKVSELENDAGYLTDIPDEYITESELATELTKIEHPTVNLDGYATEDWVNDQGFIKEIPEDYAKTEDLFSGSYNDLSDRPEIPSIEGLATTEYVDNAIAGIEIPEVSLNEYAKLSDIPDVSKFIKEIPAEYITEGELDAKGYITEHQPLTGYATEDYVKQQIAAIPEPEIDLTGYAKTEDIPTDYLTVADLEGYSKFSGSYHDLTDTPDIPSIEGLATETYVDKAIQNVTVDTTGLATIEQLATKADDIPFTEDKIVSISVGNFVVGESVKGLTIAEILAKLLGLSGGTGEPDEPDQPDVPEEPTSLTEKILTNSIPMYSVSNNGQLTETQFKELDGNAAPTESGFFVVRDENGEITKAGYQDISIANDEMYYVIALPKELDYNTMVTLEAWNSEESIWEEATMKLINDPDTVAELCAEEPPVDISHIDTNLYTIWVYEDICTGSILRYVIKEAK